MTDEGISVSMDAFLLLTNIYLHLDPTLYLTLL